MDFWSRLLGGGSGGKSASANPQQRLARFRRVFEQIRQTYDRTTLIQSDTVAAESIRANLQRLTTILQDESRSPHPHPCLSFAASANIYQTIGRIGAVAQNEGIIRETVGVFDALLDSEDDEFLANRRFAKALMLFVDRTSGSGNLYVGEETEGEIVELLFGIAAKIRLQPEILPVWFTTTAKTGADWEGQSKQHDFVGLTSKEDFPLCYQLIDHVHHEGRIGDFARTGLLYIFESASKSEALEQWIVESDLPTLMASGLGALYSQLSRKLSILHPKTELPIILQLSDYTNLQAPREAENMFSGYLQGHLETFLSYLTFWQDVLEHCTSLDVKQTLLDHFQVLFLQQLLYPSLLESSDVDGGSSVAVLTYLRRILDALDHAELVQLILQYLLALPQNSGPVSPSGSRSPHTARKRKSLLLLTKTKSDDDQPDPELFNLADLIQSSIRSSNPQTVISALKLTTVILHKNHAYAANTLEKTSPVSDGVAQRTHGALNAEIEAYLSLAEAIGGEAGMDDAYENHVKDAQRHIEIHSCSSRLLSLSSLGIGVPSTITRSHVASRDTDLAPHLLEQDGALFTQLLSMLRTFLTNNIELNLSLTEVIITLACCPYLHLEGWAAVEPTHYQYSDSQEAKGDSSKLDPQEKVRLARRQPTWASQFTPPLLKAIQDLESEVQKLQSIIPTLPQLINTRKQAFQLHGEISEAILASPPAAPSFVPRSTESANARSPTPHRPSIPGAFPSRLLERTVSPAGRSASPRGRSPIGVDLMRGPTSSPSPNPQARRSLFTSPARGSPGRSRPISRELTRPVVVGHSPQDLLDDIVQSTNTELYTKKIKFPLGMEAEEEQRTIPPPDHVSSEVLADEQQVPSKSEADEGEAEDSDDGHREVSLSHVITNIVVLQEFILELVAVVQVRASMFDEVRFT